MDWVCLSPVHGPSSSSIMSNEQDDVVGLVPEMVIRIELSEKRGASLGL